jgi:hypothetical protein
MTKVMLADPLTPFPKTCFHTHALLFSAGGFVQGGKVVVSYAHEMQNENF